MKEKPYKAIDADFVRNYINAFTTCEGCTKRQTAEYLCVSMSFLRRFENEYVLKTLIPFIVSSGWDLESVLETFKINRKTGFKENDFRQWKDFTDSLDFFENMCNAISTICDREEAKEVEYIKENVIYGINKIQSIADVVLCRSFMIDRKITLQAK